MPRYQPGRTFPAYAYLPGRDPHPSRDPAGHSHGVRESAPAYLAASRWSENADYLWGVDLYNHGYLWEAHEAWEGLWHVSKADLDQADCLQGLIQCAAACLKVPMAQPAGLARLAELGTAKLERVAAARPAGSRYMGLDLARFAADMRRFAASSPTAIDARPRIALE